MPSNPYCVFVVVGREYGARVAELTLKGPVWIVDTLANHTAVQKLWSEYPGRSHLEGVTTFKSADGCSPEDCLLSILDTIDLHHGVYSADPPYTVLEIVGTPVSDRVRAELSEFGFNEFHGTNEGFRAVRPLPDESARSERR